MGIPQITAIMGMCVAGGAYLPVMTDTVLMTEGSGLFLAGPALVQAAIGQKICRGRAGRRDDARGDFGHGGLQGAERSSLHCAVAVAGVDRLGASTRRRRSIASPYDAEKDAPQYAAEDLLWADESRSGESRAHMYDMREVIARIVDRSRFDEYKPDFGQTVVVRVCAHRRVRGGDCREPEDASARRPATTGEKRMEFGGVIYTE